MKNVTSIVQAFLSLEPTVILPVFIFIIGLGFGTGAGTAFRSGLTIGGGFVGIKLVVGLLVDNLGSATQAMVANFGIQLNVIDVGWPGSASIAWASPISAIIIPIRQSTGAATLSTSASTKSPTSSAKKELDSRQ